MSMPLDGAAFQAWAEACAFAPGDAAYLAALRAGQPVRRLRATPRAGPVRFPSRKMGTVVQCRSRLDGLPMAYELEHDAAVLEYYDLATTLHLPYTARSGKRAAVGLIPDFLVIRIDGAGFIECRSEPELQALAAAAPERFVHESGSRQAAERKVALSRPASWTLAVRLRVEAEFRAELGPLFPLGTVDAGVGHSRGDVGSNQLLRKRIVQHLQNFFALHVHPPHAFAWGFLESANSA